MRKLFLYDLDNCIIKGDITEGTPGLYEGIVKYLYSMGKAETNVFPTFEEYETVYIERFLRFDTSSLEQPFTMTPSNAEPFIDRYWKDTLQHFLIPEMISLIQEQSKKADVWVVTGSPTIYADPIRQYIPEIKRVVGIERGEIISWSFGKLSRVLSLVPISEIGGFTGETWTNDGPLLSYLRNIRGKYVDLRFVDHGQTDRNTRKNLCLYKIRRIILDPF